SLAATLKKESSVDIAVRQKDVDERIKKLSKALTTEPIDLNMKTAPVAASQKSVDLKRQRHVLNQDLSTLNAQLRETTGLIDSLEHRIHAASDLLRLKKTGWIIWNAQPAIEISTSDSLVLRRNRRNR